MQIPITLDFSPFDYAIDTLDAKRMSEIELITRDSDISALRLQLQKNKLTITELTIFYLSRIRQFDPMLHSVMEVNPMALNEAAHLDALTLSGKHIGRLHGIPVLIKDNIAAGKHMHNTAGAAALVSHRPPRDAEVVKQLRAEGALILGKTNMSEWAFFMSSNAPSGYSALGDQVVNPFGSELAVAGSSSGSAVATAVRFAAASIGTETSGSIIAPAAFNGVAGMRPSLGAISNDLIIPITHALDSAGPIARKVADLAELFYVMTAQNNDEIIRIRSILSSQSLNGLRVGIPQIPGVTASAEADTRFEAAIDILQSNGALVFPVTLPEPAIALITAKRFDLFAGSMSADVATYFVNSNASIGSLADVIEFNETVPEKYARYGQDLLIGARDCQQTAEDHQLLVHDVRSAAQEAILCATGSAQVDIFVSLDNSFSLFYAAAGTPAVTVPIGCDSTGQPHGVTFVGLERDSDANVLAIAYAFEHAADLMQTQLPSIPAFYS